MDKYFLDGSGNQDPKKTTEVVGIPYPRSWGHRTGQLREAAGLVSGLHQATGSGVSTQTHLHSAQDLCRAIRLMGFMG